ncbi:MARVEL domain-containing protein 3-like isoform X2 [Spea bombifrons]|uniref:MARVEL domain-containing protein 3-like isoform X2 n=1 Tax=Spea bombifrons TaxID=233779 RepID=UPI00234BD239|nr:MARVEL domain-containing protein 3-like isoform X2 [Spea bombifrons]
MSRSERSVQSERIPPSQRSSHDRSNREYSKNHGLPARDQDDYRERPRRERPERRSHTSNDRSLSNRPVHGQYARAPASSSEQQLGPSRASQHHGPPSQRTYTEKQSFSDKCSRLCSIRGVLQFVEITAGVLVLICVVASYAVITGYTSAAGFSTFSIDSAYSPFEGNELQQVREMDMQYTQLRAPGVYGGVAFSMLLCAFTILFLILGAKPLHSVSVRILFAELIFDALAFLAYVVAVGLYLHFIKQVNATEICKARERVYAGRGYTWMNCEVQGGDAAVAIFGLIAACLYLPSTVLCGLYIRTVRDFKENHLHYECPPEPCNQNEPRVRSREELDSHRFHPSTLV